MAFLLTISTPLFRAVHYEHHSHTNDPDRDPDLFVSRAPMWLLPVWASGVLLEYRRHYYGRKLWRSRAELGEVLVVEALVVFAMVAAVATGNLVPLAVVWLIPTTIAVLFLVMAFDYLPHYPYDSRERYLDTRAYPGRVAFAVLLGQNYHLVHHLWTTVPWYRYPRVFDAVRPELEARGSRIGWRVETVPGARASEKPLVSADPARA
jgi:beta-carotene hydroxylase